MRSSVVEQLSMFPRGIKQLPYPRDWHPCMVDTIYQVKIRIQGTVGQKCFETFNSSGLKCSVLKSFLVLSFTEDIFYHIGQFFRVETSGCRPFLRALYKGLNWPLACRTMARPVTLTMKDSFSKIFAEKISPSSILFRIDIPGV